MTNNNPVNRFRPGNTRSARLTPSQVLQIRDLYALGHTQGSLAREFNISVNQIGRIVRNEAWNRYQHVATDQEIEHRIAADRLEGEGHIEPPIDQEIYESQQRLQELLANKPRPEDAQFLTDGSKFGARSDEPVRSTEDKPEEDSHD